MASVININPEDYGVCDPQQATERAFDKYARMVRFWSSCWEEHPEKFSIVSMIASRLGDEDEYSPEALKVVERALWLFLEMAVSGIGPKHSPSSGSSVIPGSLQSVSSSLQCQRKQLYATMPLDTTASQIRLLELPPGDGTGQISCRLFSVESVNDVPFEAVSYVWGSWEDPETLRVNGVEMAITSNLNLALRCLQDPQIPRIIWVDALCINQDDVAEKSHQVSLMHQIYQQSSRTLIFLGPDNPDSVLLFDFLQDGCEHFLGEEGDYNSETLRDHLLECHLPITNAYAACFFRPWFSRLWTRQEYLLPKRDPWIYCGRQFIDSAKLLGQTIRTTALKDALCTTAAWTDQAVGDLFPVDNAGDVLLRVLPLFNWRKQRRIATKTPGEIFKDLSLRQCESTDPRDTIFGMWALFDPISCWPLKPNYEMSIQQCFARMTAWLLMMDAWSEAYAEFPLLSSDPSISSATRSSSWILDFRYSKEFLNGDIKTESNFVPNMREPPLIIHSIMYFQTIELDAIEEVWDMTKIPPSQRLRSLWLLERYALDPCHRNGKASPGSPHHGLHQQDTFLHWLFKIRSENFLDTVSGLYPRFWEIKAFFHREFGSDVGLSCLTEDLCHELVSGILLDYEVLRDALQNPVPNQMNSGTPEFEPASEPALTFEAWERLPRYEMLREAILTSDETKNDRVRSRIEDFARIIWQGDPVDYTSSDAVSWIVQQNLECRRHNSVAEPLQKTELGYYRPEQLARMEANHIPLFLRQLLSSTIFITQCGFSGTNFFRTGGFQSGDKVVLLAGVPTPMVVREIDDEPWFHQMIGAAVVQGLMDGEAREFIEEGSLETCIFSFK